MTIAPRFGENATKTNHEERTQELPDVVKSRE